MNPSKPEQARKGKFKVYGGGITELIIVDENLTHAFVCSEAEYKVSKKEKRQPVLVGFRKEFMVKEAKPL